MSYSALRLTLTGEAPLVMANGQLADPLHPLAQLLRTFTAKRHKTDADHEKIAEIEFLGSLWLDDGQPCIPAEAIEAAFVEAARRKRLGRAARAGLICPAHARLDYDGPTRPEELWECPAFRLRVPVRVQAHRVMRTRPLFPAWSATVELHYLPSLLNEREVLEILRLAGEQVGVGGWRPRFGRFAVTSAAGDAADGDAADGDAARLGGVRPGLARQALARHGKTGQGKTGQSKRGRAGHH